MTLIDTTGTCTVGVLDYKKYTEQLVPLVERARRKGDGAAVEEIRAMLMGMSDASRRAEALSQLERIEVAVQSRRWHRSAAGLVLEAACVPDPEVVPDLMPVMNSASDILYDWNDDFAEQIYEFLGFLSDRTLVWASPQDAWRAIVAPEELVVAAEAVSALSPRELRKLLSEAEEGDIFSEADALELSTWWEALRKAVRVASKTDDGLYISVVVEL